ncbi:MAG: Hsp20/alpha crystallin family protein [Planctomycetota bacterium]|nr:Hsp20/alpha crystallin family protein [Planctomycetota bacterium]
MLRINSQCLSPALAFRTDMDQLIADVFGPQQDPVPTIGGRRGHPAVDVWEESEDYFVALDIPGLSESDVKITAIGRDLTIERAHDQADHSTGEGSEKDEVTQVKKAEPNYFHRERNAADFQRMIRFPFEIDIEHVEGSLEAGVLTIRVPKAASAKPRQITIQTR